MNQRPANFSAGPSALPELVLKELAANLTDYRGTGLSLLEVSHRGKIYQEVHNEAVSLLREVLHIPDIYEILFLGGGATLQFSMVPMNLLRGSADYVDSGVWAKKAITEAKKFGPVNVLWNQNEQSIPTLPCPSDIRPSSDSSYVHITSNETVDGIQWKSFPKTGDIPLVADMSSDMVSRQIDVSQFGLIYAGAQKNLGPAGVTVIVVHRDILDQCSSSTGSYLNYATHAKANSLYNTPPVFSIWAISLVLKYLKNRGGIQSAAAENAAKAVELYRIIDESHGFYHSPVDPEVRSEMNVVWHLADENLTLRFIQQAEENGLIGLKGHRSVGGCRASLYNAVSMDNVKRLANFMIEFARKN